MNLITQMYLEGVRLAFEHGYHVGYWTGREHVRNKHLDPTPPAGYYELEEEETEWEQ